jgi:hypothetical protein
VRIPPTLFADTSGTSAEFCYALCRRFSLSLRAKTLSQGISAALCALLAGSVYPAELTDWERYRSILLRGSEKKFGIRSHFLGMKLHEVGVHLGWGAKRSKNFSSLAKLAG